MLPANKVFIIGAIVTLIPAFSIFAQIPHPPLVKKVFRGEILYPKPISNSAFIKVFMGVFNLNLSVSFGMKNLNIAPTYGLMQCQILPYKAAGIGVFDPHSIQTVHTAGMRFSYDIFPAKEVLQAKNGGYLMFSPFLSPGYNWIEYTRLGECKDGHPSGKHARAFNVMTGIQINYMMSYFEGCGLTLGYNYLAHQFDPSRLCLDQSYLFTPGSEKGMLQYFSFGLNLYIDLGKRPEGSDDE